jgi:phospholipid/cholesterol/gamma-HCH transport system substrate-binding protein
MRRLAALVALGAALLVLVVVGVGASDSGSGYAVRAIFDNAAATVPGEDVRVAGAKVGVIEAMDVTDAKKAAITLRIDDERFTPFRSDARCTIRPQSLIGEKFVDCQPGTAARRPLGRIDSGPGEGEHLLPLANTSSPVDLDLVNDIMRRPYRERFSLLLNELGTGLAGRGTDLNEVIHRANPALEQTDVVLNVLARQNRTLAKLAADSDRVLAPLAREKRRLAGFIVHGNATAQASAERRADIERSIERLPGFLRELRPLMADLGGFAGEATPVVRHLGAAAPGLNSLVQQLGPFSRAGTPALRSLGAATDVGRTALVAARPLTRSLRRFANDVRPVSGDLDELTASLERTRGLNRFLDYVFYQTLAINGFDSLGHYLRTALLVDAACAGYANAPVASCNANFREPEPTEPEAGEPEPHAAAAVAEGPAVAPPAPSPVRAGREPVLDYLLGGDR